MLVVFPTVSPASSESLISKMVLTASKPLNDALLPSKADPKEKTLVNWTFSLNIQGRPLVTATSSDTSWPMLISFSGIGLLGIKNWKIKRHTKRGRKYSRY